MIEIKEKDYIGKGGFQKCYIHPNKEAICLKIKIDENHEDPRVDREIAYYQKIQKKGPLPFLAKYHGREATNIGIADAYDLIKDETTNTVSLTVSDYLKMENSPFSDELFLSEFKKLKNELIKNKIIVRDLTAKNVCCKILKDNSIKLIVVDGVGHRDFIPLVNWFSHFTKKKTEKIYRRKQLNSMEAHRAWLLDNRQTKD